MFKLPLTIAVFAIIFCLAYSSSVSVESNLQDQQQKDQEKQLQDQAKAMAQQSPSDLKIFNHGIPLAMPEFQTNTPVVASTSQAGQIVIPTNPLIQSQLALQPSSTTTNSPRGPLNFFSARVITSNSPLSSTTLPQQQQGLPSDELDPNKKKKYSELLERQAKDQQKDGGLSAYAGGPRPVVDLNTNKRNKTDLNIHIPHNNTEGYDLNMSVMHGLVTVSHNKTRKANGKLVNGPTTVTVFGIPVYLGRG